MKKYIANILCRGTFKDNGLYNVVNDLSLIDRRFPTLIIGWDLAVSLFPGEDLSSLNWKIDENFYWTHHKNVKRTRFEEDTRKFKEVAMKRLNSYVKYVSFNLFTADDRRIEGMERFLSSGDSKYCLIMGDEVYVYSGPERKVIGISLYEADYCGIGRDRIKMLAKSNMNHVMYNDYEIPWGIKEGVNNRRYMIPFLSYMFDNE